MHHLGIINWGDEEESLKWWNRVIPEEFEGPLNALIPFAKEKVAGKE